MAKKAKKAKKTKRYDTSDTSNKLIRSQGTNPGRSIVIRPDPATATNAASLSIIPADPTSPVAQGTLLEIGGDDENAEVVSVTLDNPNPSDHPTNNGLPAPATEIYLSRSTAKIEWGSGGVQAVAFVDFEQGFSFSVPCKRIS